MENCPITGKPCGNPRNIHVHKNVNGKITEVDCCQECGNKILGSFELPTLPAFIAIPLNVANVASPMNLMHVLNVLNGMQMEAAKPPSGPACKCGKTLSDVKKSGFGCPECYTTFAEQVQEVIPRVQAGGHQHCGKEPRFLNLESMRKNMADAIKEERYEDAAVFRDRIRELEKAFQGDKIEAP